MKKLVFAVAAALMVSFAASSCGGNEGDAAVKAYKELVEKVEKAKKDGDVAALLEIVKDAEALKEKFKDVKLTDDQKKEIEDAMAKLMEAAK